LIDPRVVLEAGYQLTVVGVAAMIAAGRLCKRLGVHRQPELTKMVLGTLIGTTVATIASAPIVAWVFGRVSLIAPLSNLAAAPLIALVQPIIFCGLLLSPMHGLASLFADAAHPLLGALMSVATTAASIPNASLSVSPTVPAALIACAMSAGVIVACASRDWMRPAAVAGLAAAVLIWLPLAPSRPGLVELHMIDVGQGDAIALRTPHAHWILFDAGRAWRGGDAGRSTILPYLGRRGGSLDLFVLSHPHTDHVGGAASVLRALRPAAYVDAGFPGAAEAYRASLDAARTSRVRWMRAHPGDSVSIDGVSITFLAPDSAWTASLDDPNLASVVTLVRVGAVRMLLMGDAERPEEEWLLHHWPGELHADILKVGHHGSSTSSTGAFLQAVRPRLALVSVGAGNSYHLPSADVMHALAAQGAQVLRTDRLGTIVARTDGEHIFVDAAGDSWELPRESVGWRTP
jgi:competence protein ComEC